MVSEGHVCEGPRMNPRGSGFAACGGLVPERHLRHNSITLSSLGFLLRTAATSACLTRVISIRKSLTLEVLDIRRGSFVSSFPPFPSYRTGFLSKPRVVRLSVMSSQSGLDDIKKQSYNVSSFPHTPPGVHRHSPESIGPSAV